MKKPSKSSSNSLTNLTKTLHIGEKAESLWTAKSAVDFAEKKLQVKLDEWQKNYINAPGNTAVRAGRQSGKSFAESFRVALFALLNPKTQTLIIGAVDRQSVELFEKVKSIILILAKQMIKGRPTMHKLELRNGSKIIALPAGRTGYGLRNYTIHKLVADEAHYIGEEVWNAVRPMLATTGGTIDMLSTPRGNEGFFYDAFQSDDFTTFHVTSEDCPRISKEFLAQEKRRMTKMQYAQEYLAEFLDALQQFFPEALIDKCLVKEWKRPGYNYLGVDFAGHGVDPNAYVTIKNYGKECYVSNTEEVETQTAWKTVQRILFLNSKHNYKKIGVDDGGLGAPILDFMLTHNALKRKAIGLNNASRVIDRVGGTSRLKGMEMYANLKIMMEQGLLKIHEKDEVLIRSLMSVQCEINKETGSIKIH